MLLFSSYLAQQKVNKITLLNLETRKYHVLQWTEMLTPYFKKMEGFNALTKNFQRELSKFLKSSWQSCDLEEKITVLDQVLKNLYEQQVAYLRMKSHVEPISPLLKYPFESQISGVSLCGYLVKETENQKNIIENTVFEAHGSLDKNNSRQETVQQKKKDIKANLENSPLSEPLQSLIRKRLNQFHAEDYWFSVHLQNIVDLILKNRDLALRQPQDDNLWLSQLDGPLRLEFVITSSSCDDCRQFFSDLRRILNENTIYLPIIIYANTPYNTKELYGSPIAIIKYDGTFFDTGFVADLPYYKKFSSNILSKSIGLSLWSQEQHTFIELEKIVNPLMIKMMIVPEFMRSFFITSLYELFFLEGTVNWSTDRWMQFFLERLPDHFIEDWPLNEKKSIDSLQKDFESLVKHYEPLVTHQLEVNESLKNEISHVEKVFNDPIELKRIEMQYQISKIISALNKLPPAEKKLQFSAEGVKEVKVEGQNIHLGYSETGHIHQFFPAIEKGFKKMTWSNTIAPQNRR